MTTVETLLIDLSKEPKQIWCGTAVEERRLNQLVNPIMELSLNQQLQDIVSCR